jgi:hypothetical protein
VLLPALFVIPAGSIAAQSGGGAASAASSGTDPIARIRDEGLNRSHVMATAAYLTDVIGPRLTGSPNLKRANEWTRQKLTEWGLDKSRLEAWGPFGRGWSLERFSAQLIEPYSFPLIAYPKAWSPGVRGTLVADVVHLDARDVSDLGRYTGKLKGAVVLVGSPREVKAHFEPEGARRTDTQLLDLANANPGGGGGTGPARGGPGARGGGPQAPPDVRARLELARRRLGFLIEEGAAALIDCSTAGDGGTLFVAGAAVPQTAEGPAGSGGARGVAAWDPRAPKSLPQLTCSVEHFNRMVRMLQAGGKLRIALELRVRHHDDDLMAYNTVADLPGTDLGDEVVMLGAHMDSWHSGTGATDNAAGVAVCMEAVRILKALDLRPRRTIRVALWSGEEQGLLGSRAYVAQHFRGPGEGSSPGLDKPEHEKLSGYFNLDNGTGKIRGVYLQGNPAVGPIFREWLQPFRDLGAATVSLTSTGGTDHLSFDGVGLPGFQFIQDPVEYPTRTHHSNQDLYDRLQADDLKQAAVIMAAFVYQTAMRDQRLPRKPALVTGPPVSRASAGAAR